MIPSPNKNDTLTCDDPRPAARCSLSIVIVNWNSKDYLRKCLHSLRRHARDVEPQIIVVDGASYDGCRKMIADEFPEVTFIQSEENIGFGRCNNLGAERATGELLLLLNPDTEITPGSLHALLETHQTLPEAAMLGAMLLNSDGSLQTTSVHAAPTPLNQALGSEFLMRLFPRSKLWGTYEAYHSSGPTAVEAISGACMCLPTKIFLEIGGFTPSYFMYAEDMDLCLKVRRRRYPIYHIPSAKIYHHGGGSSSTQESQFSTIKMREALYHYFEINHGPYVAERYRSYLLIAAFTRLILILATTLRNTNAWNKWLTVLRWTLRAASAYPLLQHSEINQI